MKNEKIATIANKVTAGAMTFIGSAFIVNGFKYFLPQLEYHVPRILLPIFHLLGHIGLAIGLLILGAALIGYGFYKWRKLEGKTSTFIIILVASFATFVLLDSLSNKGSNKTTEEYFEEKDKERASAIEDVKQTDRPKFSNSEVNKYFDDFEKLIANKNTIDNGSAEFESLLMRSAEVVAKLSNDDKYLFSQYNAKLMIEWSELK